MALAAPAVIESTVYVLLGQFVMTLHTKCRLFVGQFVGVFFDAYGFVTCFATAFSHRIVYNGLGGVFGMTLFGNASILFGCRPFRNGRLFGAECR